MRKLIFLAGYIILLILLSASHLTAQSTIDSSSTLNQKQNYSELEKFIEQHMIESDIPGVAAAIVSRDSILWMGCFGYADIEKQKPVTPATQFCLGSCTKTFTGLGLLLLAQEGKIDLETPVEDIAPEIIIDNPWRDTHPVRVKHLIEHTAGFEDSRLNWFYFKPPILTLKQAIEANSRLYKCHWPPGTRYSYSSPGYLLAGYVIEKIVGGSYEDYIKQNLLDPAGMTASTIGANRLNTELIATGYGLGNKPISTWYDYDEPAGAMNSSVLEMAKFLQLMLNSGKLNDKQIISEEYLNQIGKSTSTEAASHGAGGGYNFGIATRLKNNQIWYAHGGLVPGFNVEYAYSLDCGLGYVVMINRFGRFVYSDIIDKVEKFTACEAKHESPSVIEISDDIMSKYEGYYGPKSYRMMIAKFMDILTGGATISSSEGKLYETYYGGNKIQLIPVTENTFRRAGQSIPTRAFFESSDSKMIYATDRSYYERENGYKIAIYRYLVFGGFIIIFTPIIYALFWLPVYIFKRSKTKENLPPYLPMRIMPLLAIGSLAVGILVMSNQSLLGLGSFTFNNLIFTLSTLGFAVFSIISILSTYRSFFKPVKMLARVYAVVISVALVGMTIYLGYWGFIGIRLWAY